MRVYRALMAGLAVAAAGWGLIRCSAGQLPPAAPAVFSPPQPQQWTLPNGLTVMLLEDRELPIVQGALFIKGGSLWEPVDQPGVTGAMGDQMRQGGAGALSADALDLELEKLSASLSSSFGAEYGRIGFYALASDLERVFPMFADVALRPRFEPERLRVWKGQALESIRRRKDDPATIVGIASSQLLYGDSAYGVVLTEPEVTRITRDQLLQAHARAVRPQDAVLVVSGSVSRDAARALVERYFAGWEAPAANLVPPPVVTTPVPGLYFIKAPFQQATVRLCELGVRRLSPDYVAIEAFNEILSGAFGSRLFARIRTELGLAYSVFGGIQPGLVRGVNSISLQTKSQNTARAVAEVYRVMERLQAETPAAKELEDVQRSIENSFVFRFSSSEKITERAALLKILDYPADYDRVHLERMRALTPADIRQVARTRWDLSQFVIVVVGDESAYNSLAALKSDPSEFLRGMPVRIIAFDQKMRG